MTDLIARLTARELEKAYREGWQTGYSSGRRDGNFGVSSCDEESDWSDSETAKLIRGDA